MNTETVNGMLEGHVKDESTLTTVARSAWVILLACSLVTGCVSITKPPDGFVSITNTVQAEVGFRSQVCAGTFQATLDGNNVTQLFTPQPPANTLPQATLTPVYGGSHTLSVSADTLQYWILFPYCGAGSDTVKFTTVGPPAPKADLWPVEVANPSPATVGQHVTFTITVHNLGQADAQNVSVLFWTSMPAVFFAVLPQPNSGFICSIASGYAPGRFGMQCDSGTVPKLDTRTISVELSFPSTGNKVLAVFADPNNTIVEIDKANNNTNTTVVVQ